MRRVACALLLILGAGPAFSQTFSEQRHGGWTSYNARSTAGRTICGIHAMGGGFELQLKYFSGEPGLIIQIFRESWNVPANTAMRVSVIFDQQWDLNDTQRLEPSNIVQMQLQDAEALVFWSKFRSASSVEILADRGLGPRHAFSLRGANGAADAMQRCFRRLRGSMQPAVGAANTPPLQPPRPTQPAPRP